MNPIWAFFFKDKLRTPFSVYKMSVAEVVFGASIVFGVGYGIGVGAMWLLESASETVETTGGDTSNE